MSALRKSRTRGAVAWEFAYLWAAVGILGGIRSGQARWPWLWFIAAVWLVYSVIRFIMSFPTQRQLDQAYIDGLTNALKRERAQRLAKRETE